MIYVLISVTINKIPSHMLYSLVVLDIIIVEDDPYYFLQEGNYIPPNQRNSGKGLKDDDESFLGRLVPSYLKSGPIPLYASHV